MDFPPIKDLSKVVEVAGLTLLAMVSGFMGYMMRTLDEGGKIIWLRSFLEAIASGVVGYLGILLCGALHLSFEWTGVVVGVFGWLGATATIRILEKIVRKRLGIENATSSVGVPDETDK